MTAAVISVPLKQNLLNAAELIIHNESERNDQWSQTLNNAQ